MRERVAKRYLADCRVISRGHSKSHRLKVCWTVVGFLLLYCKIYGEFWVLLYLAPCWRQRLLCPCLTLAFLLPVSYQRRMTSYIPK